MINQVPKYIHNLSLGAEKVSIIGVQVAGFATLISVTYPVMILAKGFFVGLLTGGTYTTLSAAIFNGPFVKPLIVSIIKFSIICTIACTALLALSVIFKCISAPLAGKQITWDNWVLI